MIHTLAQNSESVTERALNLLEIGVIVIGALVVALLLRPVFRVIIRTLANRAAKRGRSRWRVRTPRIGIETPELAEARRHQRINAAADLMARLFSIVVWTFAIVLILDQLEIDALLALSGAGFLGAAVAIGGQHSVNDFVTGLLILVEDRFGEGDTVELTFHEEPIEATVVWIGAFTTRLQTEESTIHQANRHMDKVVNLSQAGGMHLDPPPQPL